jgi:hypothetical protein
MLYRRLLQIAFVVFSFAVAFAVRFAFSEPLSADCRPWQADAALADRRHLTPIEITGDDLKRFVMNFNTTPPLSNFAPDKAFVVSDGKAIFIFLVKTGCTINTSRTTEELFTDLI